MGPSPHLVDIIRQSTADARTAESFGPDAEERTGSTSFALIAISLGLARTDTLSRDERQAVCLVRTVVFWLLKR